MKNIASPLQIRVHLADGSVTTFIQSDPGAIKQLLNGFQPAQIFSREKIVLADRNSHTSFATAQVTRIDLDAEEQAHLIFPVGLVEAVELTRVKFEALIRNPVMRAQGARLDAHDKSMVAFLNAQMTDGQSVLLTMEMKLEPSGQLPDLNQAHLDGSALSFRMRTGGVAALNLTNLTRLTLFPGPLETPANAWHAQFLHTTRPVSSVVPYEAGAEVAGHLPPISFSPPAQPFYSQRK